MSEDKPKINRTDAVEYLRGVEDNGRMLMIVGDHPDKRLDMIECMDYYGLIGSDKLDFMGINRGGDGSPMFNYMATMHSADVGYSGYPNAIEPEYIHPDTFCIGLQCGCESPRINMMIHVEPAGGTSSMFGAIAARVLGYSKLYMVGVRCERGSIYWTNNIQNVWWQWHKIIGDMKVWAPKENWIRRMFEGRL